MYVANIACSNINLFKILILEKSIIFLAWSCKNALKKIITNILKTMTIVLLEEIKELYYSILSEIGSLFLVYFKTLIFL